MATVAKIGFPAGAGRPSAPRIWFTAFALVWAVAFAAGLVGLAQRITEGHRPADYGTYVTWGLWVAVYQYLVVMAAGAFLIAAAIYLLRLKALQRVAPAALLLGIVSLLAGMILVLLDLGRMERFWRVALAPDWSSIIAWVVVAYMAFLVVSAAALWLVLRPALAERSREQGLRAGVARALVFGRRDVTAQARERDLRTIRVLMILGIVPAIGFTGGEGALFGVLGARPFWNSSMFPIAFLAAAVVTAGAALTVLTAFFAPGHSGDKHDVVQFLARLTLFSLGVLLVLEFAEYSIGLYASLPAQEDAYGEILAGDYWWSFWLIHLVAGAAVPFAILALRGKSTAWLGAAAILAAVGVFTVRLNAVIPGQVIPQFESLRDAFSDKRLDFQYSPSSMEWLVSLFVVSLAVLLFYVGYQLLPVSGARPGEQPDIRPGTSGATTLDGGQ